MRSTYLLVCLLHEHWHVRSGELEERWFSSVVHVGWLGRDVVSQVLGKVVGGHSLSKNCLEVFFFAEAFERKTAWKSKPDFMCRSEKLAVRVVNAKTCFCFCLSVLFNFERTRSASQNLVIRRQNFVII